MDINFKTVAETPIDIGNWNATLFTLKHGDKVAWAIQNFNNNTDCVFPPLSVEIDEKLQVQILDFNSKLPLDWMDTIVIIIHSALVHIKKENDERTTS